MRSDYNISELRIPEIEQSLTAGQPLTAIINPSGELIVRSGSTIELGVTINNNGNQSALIDVYIDEASQPIHQWCVSSSERLGLGVGQSSEIIFQIQVPAETLPSTYNYTLVIDAPQNYPEDTPIFHKGRLTVLPFVQEAKTSTDPTFTLQPVTNSTAPIQVQPGESVELLALVHNRSNRVDLFRLVVTDLPNQWYRVIYTESFSQVGAIAAASGLELNPGEKGQIQILLTPPVDAEAAVYAPTMRLYSVNNPELVLLDVTYIQVLAIYLLDIQLLTLIGTVSNQSGVFELRLHNSGNTPRQLILNAKSADEKEHCTYQIEPDQVRIYPKQMAVVKLLVQPPHKKWWRPFLGRLFNFMIEIEDVEQLPLLIDRFNGTLHWKNRPWWHFLILILAIVGVIGALGFLIWRLLTRPPVRPEIVEFYPSSNLYEAARGDTVRLNWQISNPRELQTINIQGVSPEGVVNSRDIIYDFSKGIPNSLRDFCTIERSLICQNVPTDARNPGKYIFELSIIPKKSKLVSATKKTNVLQISPLPIPKILEFNSTQPTYQETTATLPQIQNSSPTINSNQIRLNWKISNAKQIQGLRLVGRNPEGIITSREKTYNLRHSTLDQGLFGFCKTNEEQILECGNVPTDTQSPGNYIFELTVISRQGQNETLETKKTDTIKINPLLIPSRIVEFQVNGSNALPKYQIQINPAKPSFFTFNWQVEGDKNMKVAILPAPGLVQKTGRLLYPIRQEPGTETITLQATNEAGETVSRSVIIETFLPPPPPPSPPPVVATPATPNASPGKSPAPLLATPPKTGVAKPPKVASPSTTPPRREAPVPPPTATSPSMPTLPPVPPPTATSPSPPPVVVPVPPPTASTTPPPVVVPVPPPTASTTPPPGTSPTPVGTNANEPLAPAELPPQLK